MNYNIYLFEIIKSQIQTIIYEQSCYQLDFEFKISIAHKHNTLRSCLFTKNWNTKL